MPPERLANSESLFEAHARVRAVQGAMLNALRNAARSGEIDLDEVRALVKAEREQVAALRALTDGLK